MKPSDALVEARARVIRHREEALSKYKEAPTPGAERFIRECNLVLAFSGLGAWGFETGDRYETE